ncbi:Methyltransferase-like protein 21B [Perkinsus olseni]|uniref:Methyltransferase-like protein 21B n=1 Tax=Perkinsus olseni TaxID=32597 RepID=A0A7J6L3A2_PEROL|nr:Methyltransferase-like protein 21B [Perkinsus olseni]KAF4657769.1 Methyltransferase-like protein 21B [Perkinsus olseni]
MSDGVEEDREITRDIYALLADSRAELFDDTVESRLSAALARLLARLRQNSGDQWIGNRIVKEVLLENGTDLLIRVMKRFPDLAELAGECIAAATSENVICGSGAPTTVTFGTPPHDVQFHMQTADYYGAGLGYKIWPAAIALARAIYQHDVSLGDHPKVVEIGAGVGLAGIAAAKFGEASSVCFTDRMAGSLEVAMRNAKRNCLSGRFSSKVVDWRDADGLPDDADVMLGADVIYEEAHAELIMQLLRNFHGKKAVLALMPQRPGYREFISKLRNLKSVQVAKMSVSTPIGECSILEISVID